MQLRALYIAFLFIVAGHLLAQDQHKVDSLRKVIAGSKPDTNRVNACLALYNEFHISQSDSAQKYALEAHELSKQLNFTPGLAYSYNSIGDYYNGKGNYSKALEHFTSSLALFEKLGWKKNMATVCNSIGNTYLGTGNNDKALEYYQKSHDHAKEANNRYAIGIADVGLSSVYSKEGRSKEALAALLEAYKVFDELKKVYPLAVVMSNLGSVYSDMGKDDSALLYFEKGLVLHKKIQNTYAIYSTLQLMGNVFYKKKDFHKALSYFEEAIKMCRTEGAIDNEKGIAKNISDTYKALGQYEKAYEYYVNYSTLKDSVFNTESNRQLLDVQTKYETEKKDQQIELLNKDKALKEEALSRNRLIIAFTVGGLLIVVVAFIVIFYGYKRKQKMNRILELQKSIIEEKNKSITDSIRYAKNIQEAILPDVDVLNSAFKEYFIFYKPKDIVSGDFYWVASKKDKVYFAAADCTGHGVPGAFMSMIGNTLLNDIVNEKQVSLPSEILFNLREGVIRSLKQKGTEGETKDGMDIALCCLHKDRKLEFSGANNPCWVIRHGEYMELKGDKQPIGIYAGDARSYHTHSVQLEPDDLVYVFTDGFADQFGGEKGKKFKYKKLKELLLANFHLPLVKQQELLLATYESWRGSLEQVDDILIMGIRV